MSYESDLKYAEELVNIVKFFQNNTEYLDYRGAYNSTISTNTDILGLGTEYKYGSHDYDWSFKYLVWDCGPFYYTDENENSLIFSDEDILCLNSEDMYFQYSTLYTSSILRALVVFNTFNKANFDTSIFIDLDFVHELNQVLQRDSEK